MRRLPLPELAEGERALSKEATRYVLRVLRLGVGAELEVFDPRTGAVARARVTAVEREVAHLAVATPTRAERAEPVVILVQGYPKGDKLADVVRDATELGATMIVPAVAARSVARPEASKGDKKLERLEAVAAEAARQCGRARAPTIVPALPWGDALAIAREALGAAGAGFALWERATVPLGPELLVAARDGRPVALAVGPEGGLADEEIEVAASHGFAPRSLGATILRTETVAAASLGALAILRDVG